MNEIADQIFNEIKHGDDSHKAWLLETLCNSPTLQALQRRVEWMRELPTQKGYYWFRYHPNDTSPKIIEVHEVVDFWTHTPSLMVEGDDDYKEMPIGEWQKVEPPHEARG